MWIELFWLRTGPTDEGIQWTLRIYRTHISQETWQRHLWNIYVPTDSKVFSNIHIEVKRPPQKARLRWQDNIKMDLKQIEWEGVDWFQLTLDRSHW
jgi:hypothetical protein